MASLCSKPNGSRYIQFSPGEVPSGPRQSQRPKISLGKVTKKQASTAQGHIENLCRARKTGTAIPNVTADWLETLGDTLRSRLEVLGLVELRESQGILRCKAGYRRTLPRGRILSPIPNATCSKQKKTYKVFSIQRKLLVKSRQKMRKILGGIF